MFRVLQPLYVGRINRADLSQREQRLALGYTRILMWFDDRRWKTDRFDGLPLQVQLNGSGLQTLRISQWKRQDNPVVPQSPLCHIIGNDPGRYLPADFAFTKVVYWAQPRN